jgi:UDP-2,3-diacylglucosamine hydrolase
MHKLLKEVAIKGEGCIDFISDLHLQPSEIKSFEAWVDYMRSTPATALFILGDFFEVWAGDDFLKSSHADFENQCINVIQEQSKRISIYFMAGNRDFLIKDSALDASNMKALEDPCLLSAQGKTFVLSHGDAMCLSDVEYLKFREMVRNPNWQIQFLSKPLEERLAIAKAMRIKSEEEKAKYRTAFEASKLTPPNVDSGHQNAGAQTFMGLHDVDYEFASSVLDAFNCDTLIHGHTHRPGEYALSNNRRRIVLSDWDAYAQPKRLEILRLQDGHLKRHQLERR